MGQRILERLTALETQATDIQLAGGATDDRPIRTELDAMRAELQKDMEELRTLLDRYPTGNGPMPDRTKPLLNSKECLPSVLGNDYKSRWRTWSYKARDYLSLLDDSLGPKLALIESMTTPLTAEQIRDFNVSAAADAEIRRLLVRRLERGPCRGCANPSVCQKAGH